MRVLFGFMCMLALLAVPLSASAQVAGGATSSVPGNAFWLASTQNLLPPLMLRTSYRYLDVDPLGAEPSLELGVDSAGLEVTPTAPPTLEELEQQEAKKRRRRLGLGIGIPLAVVAIAAAAAAAAAAASINRGFQ